MCASVAAPAPAGAAPAPVPTSADNPRSDWAHRLLSPFWVLVLVYFFYVWVVYSGLHQYVYLELLNLVTRIIGFRPSGFTLGVYAFGGVALVTGYLGGSLLARRVESRDAAPRPFAGVTSRPRALFARAGRLPVVRTLGLGFAACLVGWLIGFAANALQINVLGVASLTDIGSRWRQSAVLVYLASLQIFFVPALIVLARKRWQYVIVGGLFVVSTLGLGLLGARNLPAKLVVAAFLAAVYRVPTKRLWQVVVIAAVVFGLAFGVIGAMSKSGIYGPQASAKLAVALGYADSVGATYNFDRVVKLTPVTGAYGGKLLFDSARSLIPGVKADYANYQLGQYLGGRKYFVVDGVRIDRSVSLSTTLLGAPYADWGVPGVLGQMILIGLLFGYLQRRSAYEPWLIAFLALFAAYVINGVNAGVFNPHAIVATAAAVGVALIDAASAGGRCAAAGGSEAATS